MSVKQFSQNKPPLRSRGTPFKVVTDRHGQSYQLLIASQGDRHALKLYDGSTWVGEARCSWQVGGWMVLDDIAIANNAQPKLTLWDRFRQLIGDGELEPVNYRQRGLGTILLANTVEHARKLGATALRGEVFQPDVENTPGLLNWYERQGFVQSVPSPGQLDVLANITLELVAEAREEPPANPLLSGLDDMAPVLDQPQLSSSSH